MKVENDQNTIQRLITQSTDGLIRLKKRFNKFDSKRYWVERYQKNGNSGLGSYGKLAEFKGIFLNKFVKKNSIKQVLEYGCGDGNQLKFFKFPKYIGLDISPESIEICDKMFPGDKTKSFFLYDQDLFIDNAGIFTSDLVLSLDVLYHLVETDVFEKYMHNLFITSSKYVIIYSSNTDRVFDTKAIHVKHRVFTEWVSKNIKNFKLVETVKNKYSLENNLDEKSFADFYVYKRNG